MNEQSEQPDHDFSAAQFASLAPIERDVLQEVAKHLSGEDLDPADDETLRMTFNILRPCDGCVPDDEIGEDLLQDIRRKFSCIYYTAVERAETDLKTMGLHFFDDFSLCLVIDPSYEDSTHVAVVDLCPDARPFCYFHEYAKAWHVSFTTLKEIADEVLRAQAAIVSTFRSLNRSAASGQQPTAQGETHGQPT